MASTTVTPSTFAVLTDSVEAAGRSGSRSGAPSTCSTRTAGAFGGDARGEYMTLPVFPVGGGDRRKVTVRDNTPARVLSYVGNWDPNREVFV
ncbi:hypothetical protein [Promicromonospora kroppenstedtii]|uniref:hypothetical protein n=1 Tax=Promicromonospora kroppenstedtii TaxID=440482 RepID=UPI0004AC60DF|nr:hypothetical protein [Promicromonospora kroppenstedtii]